MKPLPTENQPEGFYGLVGSYTISAQASPTDVSVGDPITLTLRIGGSPYLKPVRWPALEKVPALADNFRIPSEKASPELVQGHKTFIQTIRAKNNTVTEIPPIPLVTFDPQTGSYRSVASEPIPLTVAASHVLGSGDLSVAMRASMAVPGAFSPVVISDQVLSDGRQINLFRNSIKYTLKQGVGQVDGPNPLPGCVEAGDAG